MKMFYFIFVIFLAGYYAIWSGEGVVYDVIYYAFIFGWLAGSALYNAFKDRKDKVLYIGSSKNLMSRVSVILSGNNNQCLRLLYKENIGTVLIHFTNSIEKAREYVSTIISSAKTNI